jgi:hypothetical protein
MQLALRQTSGSRSQKRPTSIRFAVSLAHAALLSAEQNIETSTARARHLETNVEASSNGTPQSRDWRECPSLRNGPTVLGKRPQSPDNFFMAERLRQPRNA